MQTKQSEWYKQWCLFEDNELFLFKEWIQPYSLESFKKKNVLECGCGGGQHTSFIAPYAKSVTAVDLNTIDIAKKRNINHKNIKFFEADILTMDLKEKFDLIFSIGVIHHTDSPEKAIINMKKHLKKGGLLIAWVYSEEGNWLVKHVVDPLRRNMLVNIEKRKLFGLSKIITGMMYLPIYTIYLFPLTFLPFYEYFQNFRKLSFHRNTLNVFDKLNAPQVDFISKKRAKSFVSDMKDAKVIAYKGVSYSISGVMKENADAE
jgi:SAM-dependent methyltransferase